MSVILVDKNARIPSKSSEFAAGYDLRAVDDVVVGVGERKIVSTGLRISCPEGTYGRIAPRSGLALKNGLDVMAGVIDPDYIGIVGVVLINFGELPFNIKVGDGSPNSFSNDSRLGRRFCMRCLHRTLSTMSTMSVIERTGLVRGSAGFGSSGIE